MSQTDYKTISIDPIDAYYYKGQEYKAKIIGVILDRSYDKGIHVNGIVISEPDRPIRISFPDYWIVEGQNGPPDLERNDAYDGR